MTEKQRIMQDVRRVAAALGIRPGVRMPSQGKLAPVIGTHQPSVSQAMIALVGEGFLARTPEGFVLADGALIPADEPRVASLAEFRPTPRDGRAPARSGPVIAAGSPRLAFQPFGGPNARTWIVDHPGGNEVRGEATDEIDVLARFGIPGGSRHVWNERARAAFLGSADGGEVPDRIAIATFGGPSLRGAATSFCGAGFRPHRTPEEIASVASGGEASMRVVRLRLAVGPREVAEAAGWAAHLAEGIDAAVVADCEVVVRRGAGKPDAVATARVLWRRGEHVCGAEIASVPKEL